jgi:hypothetical protein
MKTLLAGLLALMFFLSGCVNAPVSTPPSVTNTAQQIPAIVTPIVPTATVDIFPITATLPSPTTTTYPSTPTFISASPPNDLTVAYVAEGALWVWNQNSSRLLLERQNISAPVFSDDGQWLLFRERHGSSDGSTPPSDELWGIRSDGSEIKCLVGSDDLLALTGKLVLMDYFSWVPGHHEVLFNNEEIIDGPPGSRPLFDLYSVDLAGQVTQLIEPGDAGRFVSSPDGVHVALMTGSRIKVFDLETGKQRTLLEFEPVEVGIDGGPRTPRVVWDPQGQFVITWILPPKFYYPEYAGEPEQVWRLFVDGQVELVAELQPFSQFTTGIAVAPNFQYFFYLKEFCPDATGTLYMRSLTSAEESPLSCLLGLPQWTPDSEHFIYKLESWQLGNIYNTTSQPLDFLNVPTDPDVYALPQLTWINDEYFLLLLRSQDVCTLNVATLQGVVTEIASTPPDVCPQRVDFSLPK